MASTESIYESRLYSTEPKDSLFTGYNAQFSSLGTSLDARTANQIKEVSKHLNTGLRNVEIAGHDPGVFDSIPKEHFKEINRLAKLTNAELSVHAPMVEPTGIVHGNWSETNRKSAEMQLWNSVERSHELAPEGNIIVNFHASTDQPQLPSAEFKTKEGKIEKTEFILYVNPEGKIGQIKNEQKFFPSDKGEISPKFNPVELLKTANKEVWDEQLGNMNYYANQGANIAENISRTYDALASMPPDRKEYQETKEKTLKELGRELPHADLYLRNAYRQLKANFDMVYKDAGDDVRESLNKFRERAAEALKENEFSKAIEDPKKLKEFAGLIEEGINTLRRIEPEKVNILRPLKDFAIEQSAETAAEVAFKSYNKFHDSAPIIALENHPAQQSIITTGEELKQVVELAREKFIEKAQRNGVSDREAVKQAEKLIGATWDVGHINMMRKYGYTSEDIIEQTKAVAPFVKHIHLSDNFGFEHTELPMGMGNVPFKGIMEKIDKAQEGFKGKKVIEALAWWQHFSEQGVNHAIIPTMNGLGAQVSPNYSWNRQYGIPGGYSSGYGTMLPEQNFSTYGAGFAGLPTELGGQIPGKQSRLSGAPMT